jgi:hypothetical protein
VEMETWTRRSFWFHRCSNVSVTSRFLGLLGVELFFARAGSRFGLGSKSRRRAPTTCNSYSSGSAPGHAGERNLSRLLLLHCRRWSKQIMLQWMRESRFYVRNWFGTTRKL